MDLPYHPTSRSSHRYVSKSCSGPGWQSRMKGTDFVVAVFVVYIISLQGFVLFCFKNIYLPESRLLSKLQSSLALSGRAAQRQWKRIAWPLNALCASLKSRKGKKEKEKNDFPVHCPLAGSCTKFNLYFL